MEELRFDLPQLTARPHGCTVPLTVRQTWIWNDLLRRQRRLSDVRICADSARLTGRLDIARLTRSIQAVVHRHESLRTRIVQADGVPTQMIDPPREYCLSITDLSRVPAADQETHARELAESFVEDQIDLSAGPLFQPRLIRLSKVEHLLVLAIDHIICDAASCTILRDEIWETYNSFSSGDVRELPPLNIQFPDLAVWQHGTQERWIQRDLPYWRRKLETSPSIRLPPDNEVSGPEQATASVILPFGKRLSNELRDAARSVGTRLPLLVLTLYVADTFVRHGYEDLLVTFLSHGRHGQPELKNMIGDLAHFVYLRFQLDPAENLSDLARKVEAEFSTASAHDASRLPPPPAAEHPTDLYFNWLPSSCGQARQSDADSSSEGGLKRRHFPLRHTPPAKFAPLFFDGSSGLTVSVLYRPDLFKRSTVERFGNDLRWLARQFIENPVIPLGSIALPT